MTAVTATIQRTELDLDLLCRDDRARLCRYIAVAELQRRIVDPPNYTPGIQRRRREAVLGALRADPSLLDRLTARQREAVTFRYVEGLSYEQITARMGVNMRTVAFHLDRARVRILSDGEVTL